jgi:glutamyl-Q tRNA(Asp) synthetase
MSDPQMPSYVGRFAPSPTGPLHFGSLVTAVGSCLQARRHGGHWLIRIEDIDRPRVVHGAAADQVRTLGQFGLVSDAPVTHQSTFHHRHHQALRFLLNQGHAFHCVCTRRELPATGIYPGTCRHGPPAGRPRRSVRLKVGDHSLTVADAVQGSFTQDLGREVGDFIILRGDGLIAYQLAVVVDDHASAITEVVRGADLLESTPRQMLIYHHLGWPLPRYVHLPVVTDANGRKLSKSDHADPIQADQPAVVLRQALSVLGHPPPVTVSSLASLWEWATTHWDLSRVPRGPVVIPSP